MLCAALAQIRQRQPDARFTLIPSAPGGHQPLERFAHYGLSPKLAFSRWHGRLDRWCHLIPTSVRARYGLLTDQDVEVVLDLAGFAYGEPWPQDDLRALAIASKRWADRGVPLFLLPQAFGSFKSARARRDIRSIVEHATWVFARDEISLAHLQAAVGAHERVSLSPDFTALLPGIPPDSPERFANTVVLIPNHKVTRLGASIDARGYLDFLSESARALLELGADVQILCHEGRADEILAEAVMESVPAVRRIAESDPLKVKGILGACLGSIGGRYHGLISCLSQGVPALGTSWSHKYPTLFESYDFKEGLLDIHNRAACRTLIEQLVDPATQARWRAKLLSQAAQQREANLRMWDHVFSLIPSRA